MWISYSCSGQRASFVNGTRGPQLSAQALNIVGLLPIPLMSFLLVFDRALYVRRVLCVCESSSTLRTLSQKYTPTRIYH
jgi:hypothetical protein